MITAIKLAFATAGLMALGMNVFAAPCDPFMQEFVDAKISRSTRVQIISSSSSSFNNVVIKKYTCEVMIITEYNAMNSLQARDTLLRMDQIVSILDVVFTRIAPPPPTSRP